MPFPQTFFAVDTKPTWASSILASQLAHVFMVSAWVSCIVSLAAVGRAQQVGGNQSSQSLNAAAAMADRLAEIGPAETSQTQTTSATEVLPEALKTYQDKLPTPLTNSRVSIIPASFHNETDSDQAPTTPPSTTELIESNLPPDDPIDSSQLSSSAELSQSLSDLVSDQAENMMSRKGTASSVKVAILLATLSLAPAIILMTTCYVRVIVVLTLLRQAFGAQQLPSTQILTALSLFVTFLVMAPTWNEIKTNAIDPYTQSDGITWDEAWQRGVTPIKKFMSRQIDVAGNEDSIALFYRYLPNQTSHQPASIEDVPLNVLMPAFLVSELKVAFLLGFQVYLPFLVVDLVVSSVTVSMGMVMLPPTIVSFPLKLILFVLVDGWNLVIGMLLQSFAAFT